MAIKKGWKITWITVGTLVGLVVLTVMVALWLIFTPSKLTKIVNSLAGNFITCDARFGNVDLTLLSTFPDAGLRIDSVVIVNPGKGPVIDCEQNDTVAKIGSLTVGIDVKAFLKENKVIVHKVIVDDVSANLYIAEDGTANFDIFPKSEDTDTSSSGSMPSLIDLKKIKINNLNAIFANDHEGQMSAEVWGVDVDLKGLMKGEDIVADLKMEAEQLFFSQGGAGTPMLAAHAKGLEMKVDGKKEGEHIEADVKLDGKNVDMDQIDSLGRHTLKAVLDDLLLKVEGNGDMDEMRCQLNLGVEKGTLETSGTEMVNQKLRESKKDLLSVEMPDVVVKVNKKEVWLSESKVKIDDYALMLNGQCYLATEERPLTMDMAVETDGSWRVAPLLDIVPQQYVGFRKGMDLDGDVSFGLNAGGTLTDSTMPNIVGTIMLVDGRFYAPKMLPYKVNKVKGKMGVDLYLDQRKESHVTIENLRAHTQGTDVMLNGQVDDLLGDMRVDARVKGTLPLEDVEPMIPKGMNLVAKGDADLDLKVDFKMSQLQKQTFDKMKVNGIVKMDDVDVAYDSLHGHAGHLDLAVHMPSRREGRMADVELESGKLKVAKGKGMALDLENATVKVGLNDVLREQLAAEFDIEVGETDGKMDSTIVLLSEMKLRGVVRLDSTKQNVIKQYNPQFDVTVENVLVYTPQMPENVRVSEFGLSYSPALLDIRTAKVKIGHSDFELYGEVENLEDWLDGKAMLKGDLNFTSDYADVDQLMNMFSGMGSNEDTLAAMRKKDSVPAEANPFIVPRDVNVTLHTHVKRSIAFGNDLHDVAGALTVNDGRVVLDQMGFVCKAATMQLTALYRSPRPGNLFAAIDFHLLDIEIDELLDMIPAVDTLVPMLSAFDGNANFHLAGESYLDAFYRPKLPSVKGAAAISGKDLVVMDNSDLATIAKLMRFKSWKDKDNKIKIDSLSVEMTCMDEGHGAEIEILPFLLSMGSYQICISGVQGVNMDCSYHLELLKNPLLAKVGVDVKGSIRHPKIRLGRVIYADLFRPQRHGVAEKKAMEIKNKVRQALEANVR